MGKRGMLVMCLNDCTVYESASAAAACVGVNKSTMSRHLSGKYASIKGKEYVYIDPMVRWEPERLQEIQREELKRRHGILIF